MKALVEQTFAYFGHSFLLLSSPFFSRSVFLSYYFFSLLKGDYKHTFFLCVVQHEAGACRRISIEKGPAHVVQTSIMRTVLTAHT